MRTLLVYLFAAGILAGGLWFGFPEWFGGSVVVDGSTEARSPAAPPVIVAEAVTAPLVDAFEALGTVRANESVEIRANRADTIEHVHFEDGAEVKADTLLVTLRSAEERAALAEAVATLEERRLAAERAKRLLDREMGSVRDHEQAAAALAAAEARVLRWQAAVADLEVRVPFAGTLGFRQVSPGAYLQPSTVITTLDDLSVVRLDFTVPESWVPHLRPGLRVDATSIAWPDRRFEGVVQTIATRLDPTTRSATVRARLPNPQRALRPGMLLKVTVHRGAKSVLQVPEEAVVPLGREHFVYRVDVDGVAQRIAIRLGRRRPGRVEVVSGLTAGDRVVIEGIVRVRPGAKVRVVESRRLSVATGN